MIFKTDLCFATIFNFHRNLFELYWKQVKYNETLNSL